MIVLTQDVGAGELFATADPPPGNLWMMCVPPSLKNDWQGLAQNVNDESYWLIEGDRFVRKIHEDEYDETHFYA